MKWTPRTLDELGYLSRGRSRHRPRDSAHLYGGPYPFVQTGDVKHSTLYLTTYSQTYSEAGLAQSRLWNAGTLCITIAANIADTAILGMDACFPDSVIGFVPDDDKADARFIKYLFDVMLQKQFKQFSQGATQDNLSQSKLLSISFPVPDVKEQHRLADILSAYDDLIENNRRRIQLLEQAVRLLYKEWFVHLRFPGHEHVTITDGVPEGWEKVPVSSFCTVGRGGSPRPIKNFMDGTVPWFKIGDATASESPFVFSTKELLIENGVKKSVLLSPQELVLSNSATCGIPYFTGVTGCIHDGWLYFKKLRRVSKWFLFCCLFAKQREILMGIGEGATQKNLNTDYIGRQLVLLPRKKDLLANFTETVEPFFNQIYTLAQANRSLTQARNLLLPRLINGEVAV